MQLDFQSISSSVRYKLLTATIVPRPIALVTTLTPEGRTNAAPFSFFNVFSETPPLLVLGLQSKPDLTLKDTTENIRRTKEFVVNLVDEAMASAMVKCAADLASEESEIPYAGLSLTPSKWVNVDEISEAPFRFSCRVKDELCYGDERTLIIGEVLGMTASAGLIDPETMRVNWDQYSPVGRLFGSHYIRTNDQFSITAPDTVHPDAAGSTPS
ncbi:MAG: nitrilotriacetate monooxygenase [Blastopirellula sp.]|nr:MAG: nitrilotriacetate monooxygenase [Blastopirellula sp.]